jgi:hypothetical protein
LGCCDPISLGRRGLDYMGNTMHMKESVNKQMNRGDVTRNEQASLADVSGLGARSSRLALKRRPTPKAKLKLWSMPQTSGAWSRTSAHLGTIIMSDIGARRAPINGVKSAKGSSVSITYPCQHRFLDINNMAQFTCYMSKRSSSTPHNSGDAADELPVASRWRGFGHDDVVCERLRLALCSVDGAISCLPTLGIRHGKAECPLSAGCPFEFDRAAQLLG